MNAPLPYEQVNLPRDEGGPVFDHPWQAQAFALTVELYKKKLFTWPEWVEVFSKEIKAFPELPGEGVNDAYYRQWMSALQKMVASLKLVAESEIVERSQEWRQAHLNTPHGQPVLLMNASCPPKHDHDHGHHHHDHDHHHHEHGHDHHHHEHGHDHHHHDHAVKRGPITVSAALSH